MPVATMLPSTVHQAVNLTLGEIASLDCQVFDGWSAFSGPRFHRNKAPIPEAYWLSYTHFLHSRKGTAWSASRSQSRMEAPERARSMVAQAAGQPHFCLATERLCGPPLGWTFWFQILIQASSPEIWRKTISGGVGGCWRGKWVACFGLPPWKKFSAA